MRCPACGNEIGPPRGTCPVCGARLIRRRVRVPVYSTPTLPLRPPVPPRSGWPAPPRPRRPAGIVSQPATEEYIGKVCPYCRTAMQPGEQVVVCPECKVPHHAECWQENRSCTTYGCRGGLMAAPRGSPTPVEVEPGPDTWPVRPYPAGAWRAQTWSGPLEPDSYDHLFGPSPWGNPTHDLWRRMANVFRQAPRGNLLSGEAFAQVRMHQALRSAYKALAWALLGIVIWPIGSVLAVFVALGVLMNPFSGRARALLGSARTTAFVAMWLAGIVLVAPFVLPLLTRVLRELSRLLAS